MIAIINGKLIKTLSFCEIKKVINIKHSTQNMFGKSEQSKISQTYLCQFSGIFETLIFKSLPASGSLSKPQLTLKKLNFSENVLKSLNFSEKVFKKKLKSL
jgi:hypothetical protein